MRYFVVAMDGKVYGPVDIPTLNVWIKEGRVRQDTELREEGGTVHIRAGLIPELQAALSQVPHSASYPIPNPPCGNCGQPFDHSSRVCPNCGMPAFTQESGKLVTGNATGDRVLGFVIGFFCSFLWGLGAIAGLVLYAVLRPNYPKFARGIGFGMLSILVILLGLFALCIVGLSFASFR